MTQKNTLDRIQEEEKKAEKLKQKVENMINDEMAKEKAAGEEKISMAKKSLDKEIKAIMAETDRSIERIRKNIKEEAEKELEKIRRIPPEKKQKAVDQIVRKIIN
ncbi:MAG: hypothetical protein ABIH38_05375 [Patescibacteria group bacterium]